MSEYIPKKNKDLVFKRANGCCEYCQSRANFSPSSFSIEHIVPKSKDGSNKDVNLALACQGCNNFKHTKVTGYDKVSEQEVALYNPRKNNWKDHFKWSEDFTTIIGISAIGRATVETLKLNRTENVNLRIVLFPFGEHPPTHTL